MYLYELNEGQSAVIERLHFDAPFAKRLRDMGFCEGETVVCIKRAIFGSPVLYRVKDSQIALRKKDAERVEASYA